MYKKFKGRQKKEEPTFTSESFHGFQNCNLCLFIYKKMTGIKKKPINQDFLKFSLFCQFIISTLVSE